MRELYTPTREEFIKLTKKGNLIPVYREFLADLETPVSSFLKIADDDYSYLLESVEYGEKIGRYSFLGSKPSLIFETKNTQAKIITSKAQEEFELRADPLVVLKNILNKYHFVNIPGLPRFCGGLVGYLGYDIVRFFENIPASCKDELNLPDCVFVLTDTLVIFDHIKHKIKVVACAYIRPKASVKGIKKTYEEAQERVEAIVKRLRKPLVVNKKFPQTIRTPKLKIKSNLTKEKFKKIVKKAKKYIREGDIIQTVLSQRFETQIKVPPFSIYRALRSINPSPYMYYLKFKDLILVGSSPEVHVRCEAEYVEIRPIAGTRPRGRDEQEDKKLEEILLNDPKERAEHLMLVDLGRNDIGRVCRVGSVNVQELMIIENYSHVKHIVSDVTGRLKPDKDIYELIRATFPAGTVTGAPKIRAMKVIDELENTKRGPYAGCVGYFSFSGNLDTCITIRTIIIKDNRAYIQAGAGIVADSNPESEYREIINKAKALIKAVQMAEGR